MNTEIEISVTEETAADLAYREYSSLTFAMTVGRKHTDPVKYRVSTTA